MSAYSFLEAIINFTIIVFVFWTTFQIYLFIIFFAGFFGIKLILFDYDFILSDMIFTGFNGLLFIAGIYLSFVTMLLLWIFIFWMIIIIFVPYFIIIPIPFIPFFIPIPLKNPMLEFIPPFKILTDRGILPLMRKIIFTNILSEMTLKSKFGNTFKDIFTFLFDEIKVILNDFFGNINFEPELNKPNEKQNISKGIQDDTYKIDTIDTNNENIDDYKKETDKYEKANELINEELEICLKTKQQFTTPDMSSVESAYTGVKNLQSYSECYAKSIKSYIENKM